MAKLTLRDAAAVTGKSKSTIQRAIKNGRLSAGKSDTGDYAIDPAELFRVYPRNGLSVPPSCPTQRVMGQDATPFETAIRLAELETENRVLKELLAEVRAARDELRADRDDWRARAERLLTDQRRPAGEGVAAILARMREKAA